MTHRLDHFAVGACDLESGVKALEQLIGVTIPAGGKHKMMGTHNALMATGNASYMELIAIDPHAPAPERIRWFSLDSAATKARLAIRPRALCWVVATDDIETVVANSPTDLGDIITLSRDDRTWRLTVPKDGSLPEGGLVPAFIEWSPGRHPSETQADLGIRLKDIKITHPRPEWLKSVFTSLQIAHLATISAGPASLCFEVSSPKGTITLD